jgi:hypothetical protein
LPGIILKQNFIPNNFGMKKIVTLLLISFPSIIFAQNVGIGTTTPVTKLTVVTTVGSTPSIPGATSNGIFRIGIATNDGVDFGKMGSPPFSGWMQAGFDGVTPDPLSIQPLGGNVGIGTISPAEKLDVTGNINVTGTIKANGVDGTANQVLMKNSSGTLSWGDMCEYKNIHTIVSTGSGSWTVPAGVTKVLVEIVAGGGGGNIHGGGGGGGYLKAILPVTAGSSINYVLGAGGTGGAGGSGTNGGGSQITYGAITIFADGGSGASFNNTTKTFNAAGGQYAAPTGISSFIGEHGERGKPNKITFEQKSATSFFEISSGGNGGGSGRCKTCETEGIYYAYDISAAAVFRQSLNNSFNSPGTGGGGGWILSSVGGFGGGGAGSAGVVIFYY